MSTNPPPPDYSELCLFVDPNYLGERGKTVPSPEPNVTLAAPYPPMPQPTYIQRILRVQIEFHAIFQHNHSRSSMFRIQESIFEVPVVDEFV